MKSTLRIDWSAERPNAAELTAFWKRADFPVLETDGAAIPRLVAVLRNMYAGGSVLQGTFSLPTDPALGWFIARNRAEEADFFDRFWFAPTPKEYFRKLHLGRGIKTPVPFQLQYPFLFEARLAQLLEVGGPYTRPFEDKANEAYELAVSVRKALFEDRFDEVTFFECHTPWSPFFQGIAWDVSFAVFDKRRGCVHLLLGSDSD